MHCILTSSLRSSMRKLRNTLTGTRRTLMLMRSATCCCAAYLLQSAAGMTGRTCGMHASISADTIELLARPDFDPIQCRAVLAGKGFLQSCLQNCISAAQAGHCALHPQVWGNGHKLNPLAVHSSQVMRQHPLHVPRLTFKMLADCVE